MSLKTYAIGALSGLLMFAGGPANAENWHVDFGGSFELLNAAGETVSEQELVGHHSLIYFGYTSCMMQCPPTWITIDRVIDELNREEDRFRAYFISVDPDRDTVDAIAAWQKNWPNITALTGSREQIHAVTDAYHVFFARKPMHAMSFAMKEMMRIKNEYGDDGRIDWDREKTPEFYMMDHTTKTFLLDENGQYVTHFELEEDPDTIIRYISEMM